MENKQKLNELKDKKHVYEKSLSKLRSKLKDIGIRINDAGLKEKMLKSLEDQGYLDLRKYLFPGKDK